MVPSLTQPHKVRNVLGDGQPGLDIRDAEAFEANSAFLIARNAVPMDAASKAELIAHLQGRDAEAEPSPMDAASKAELLAHLQGRDAEAEPSPMDAASKAELLAHLQGRDAEAEPSPMDAASKAELIAHLQGRADFISVQSELHQRDVLKRHLLKRELAIRDVEHVLTHQSAAKVMVRELGSLLNHFSKRDGSPIGQRDIQLVARDINTLMIREAKKPHVASPHEIKVAFGKAGHWLKTKAGPWLKDHAIDIVSTVVSAVPGMQPAGMAMKVASAVKTGVQAGVKADKAQKEVKKHKGKNRRDAEALYGIPISSVAKDAGSAAKAAGSVAQSGMASAMRQAQATKENTGRSKPSIESRDAEADHAAAAAAVKDAFAQLGIRSAEPEDAAAAVAKAFAELGIRDLAGPISSILTHRDIVVRDTPQLLERLVDGAMNVADHAMKREAEAEPIVDVSALTIDSLIQRSLDSIASATDVILRRDADDDVVGLSELHVRALAPHLVEAM